MPVSEQTIASLSEMLETQVNVQSPKLPRMQFLPASAFGEELDEEGTGESRVNRCCLDGELGLGSVNRQTLTCLIPTLDGAKC